MKLALLSTPITPPTAMRKRRPSKSGASHEPSPIARRRDESALRAIGDGSWLAPLFEGLRLRMAVGGVIGVDRSANFITTPGLQAATCEARFSVGHDAAASRLPALMASIASRG